MIETRASEMNRGAGNALRAMCQSRRILVLLLAVIGTAALILANTLLLVRNHKCALPPAAAAEAFLLGGYISNGIFCLIVCFHEGLQAGAYMILAVSIGYAAAIVLLSRGAPGIARVASFRSGL